MPTRAQVFRPHPRPKRKPKVYKGLTYNTKAWRDLRAQVLEQEPLCMCPVHQGADDAPASTIADHTIPHRGNPHLFWSRANLRGYAKPCHDRKTAKHDHGFGNA